MTGPGFTSTYFESYLRRRYIRYVHKDMFCFFCFVFQVCCIRYILKTKLSLVEWVSIEFFPDKHRINSTPPPPPLPHTQYTRSWSWSLPWWQKQFLPVSLSSCRCVEVLPLELVAGPGKNKWRQKGWQSILCTAKDDKWIEKRRWDINYTWKKTQL